MFPWFAIGHITPYIHLSNRLAARGHRVHFLLPGPTTLAKLAPLNRHPHLITFHPIAVPHVDGLPRGAETTADVPPHLTPLLFAALDATEDQFRSTVSRVGPLDVVLYDSAMWVPRIGRELGFLTMTYGVVSAAVGALRLVPSTDEEMARTPPGYPPHSAVVPRPDEIKQSRIFAENFGSVSLYDRIVTSVSGGDAMALRTCWELEGVFVKYMEEQYGKRALLTGPILPDRDHRLGLDEKWAAWLSKYPRGSVVYCAFGSESLLQKDQFQELLRGFELCGRPFLVVLKPSEGCATMEEGFPEGFAERVIDGEGGRGLVCGGWVPQLQILDHPSVGCFVSHCGFGSMWESLLSDCQIVLVPKQNDQIVGTMLMTKDLKVGVEVEKDEEGWVSKEKLSEAIEMVMDEGSEIGRVVRENHLKLREVLGDGNLQERYLDGFVCQLYDLLEKC
ncbi:unnamed protein product [Linum tenue]|uniref:Glycosyltransferase n=5 Tax=Linum tenue TaxID=586396 RepID=A0AAV0RFU6_9ROSI|nr:unnamed protein product [Linum tenue]